MKKLMLIVVAALSAMFGATASADGLRADWMAGKRGMMVHWLFAEAGQIDYYANAFDINKFMADFDATKSDYLIFTIGQNKGTYASPNAKLAELGIPAGCCATRDLVGEIAAAVHARGKKFIAYLPCEVNQNDTVKDLLSWSDRAAFQTKYCAVITEWATRWGTNLDGWWIDGFYNDDGHWASSKGFDQSVWSAALRAGNPNAVVTLNPGLNAQTPRSDVLSGGVLTDYLAGEINSPSAITWTLKEFADDATCRTHFLMPIDGCWGGYWPWESAYGANPYTDISTPDQTMMNRLSYVGLFPDPVVSESDLSAMITRVFAVNGAVTINIGVNASGTLNPASVALLAKMPGGSTSASADPGTTVESLIGLWSSTPMASDGSTFSTDGDLVYAYCTASENKSVNGITFTGLGTTPATASADFEFAPAFNTTQNADSDGMSGDLETIARLTWKNDEKGTGGYATMTFKGLTAGKRYCIQLYIHDTYCRNNAAVFGPDAKSTVFYREEENDPKSGQDWTCGGVFTGVITAKGTTHEITLYYPTTDRIELNALQVRCLGDAIVRPEDAPVAEESVINAMAWDALFPTAATYLDTETSFTLPYRQHSPTTADGVKYPLVIFLHGAGEVGTDNAKQVQTDNDVIPITKYAMKHGDAFVLAPQCPGASGSDYSMTWSGANWNSYPMTRLETPTQPMAAVIKLVTEFIANNPVDPTRIYVTGLSMGGFGTWDLASRMSDTFAAVMPCCGGADPNAAALYDDGMAIRFFHGSSDNVVSPDFSRGMDTALTTAGIEHEYIEYSGVNHVDCWRKAYVDTDLNLEWLFGHIKGEEYVAPDHGDTTENAPLSTVASGGWLGWKLKGDGSAVVNVGTKVWAYAQNYSCRQGHFNQNLVVNEVEFIKSGNFAADDTGIKNAITCDKTFGYGRDSFGDEGLGDGVSDFARMIKTGWEATGDQGPVQTYTLHGLTSGKTYLVQFIYHCASTDRAALSVIAPDDTTSTRVNGWDANGQNLDENWRYGGSLIGVFTATGTDQELVITYSKTANYLLNAVQLREVTVDDLTKAPEIVYGTPTIGSVTPSVNGTTATLTLANVTVGQNGGCYQVWLAYAEDGMTLGSETAALISQQSASCAVEIKNLTAGKKYNYSLYVKNEGNVISEKKTGSFTVPGGEGPDPVIPPSGDGSGNWTATPMDAAGEAFSREGDPVFAFMRDRGDPHETTYKEMVSGLYFNWINLPTDTVTKNHATGEAMNGVDNMGHDPAYFMSMSPAFNNATDKCGDGGLTDGNDGFAGMLMRAWTGSTLDNIGDDAGQATLTLNNLTADRKYCLQIFIHEDSPDKLKGIKAPDGTIAYAGNFGGVTDCPRGSVLTCTFTATGTTESFDLVYLDRGSYQMNAIQLRDLGEAGDDPEPQGETIASEAAKLGLGYWLAMPLTGDPADIVTDGTLVVINNKKLSGAKSNGTVNGVSFGGSWSGDGGMTSTPNVSNGKNNCTDCNVSDTAYNNILKNAFTGKSAVEHQVFTFAGLIPDATYLVQYICHGQSEYPRSATVADARGTHSIEVSAATSSDEWYYGGTLIHVFKADANGAYELTIDFRDSKGAVDALVNAFQVRQVEAREDPVDPPSGEDVWIAIPMTSNGSVFSTDGDLVFAFSRDRGDPGTTYENFSTPVTFNYINSLTDTVTKYHPWQHEGEAIDGPYGNGLQPADYLAASPVLNGADGGCGDEGLGSDMSGFGSMLTCMWTGPSLSDTGNKATFTFKRLTSGHRYLVEFFIHRSNESAKAITAPDGTATIYYGGTGWQYGGLLRGTFTAAAATHDVVLTYSDPGSYGMGAIQLRDLGVAPEGPSINEQAAELAPGEWLVCPLTGKPGDIVTCGELVTKSSKALTYAPHAITGDDSVSGVSFLENAITFFDDKMSLDLWSNYKMDEDSLGDCGLAGAYGKLIANGWGGQAGSGCANPADAVRKLKLNGLESGKTYLIQGFVHDGSHPTRKLSVGSGTITYGAESSADEWYYGGTFVHVFTVSDGTYEFDLDYTAGQALVNALQLREIETVTPPPAHEHEWSEWVTNTPPTATTPGERTRTCIADGCTVPPATEVEVVPATGGGDDPVDPPQDGPGSIVEAAAVLAPGCWYAAPLTGDPADIVTNGTMATTTVAGKGAKSLSGAKSYGTVNGVDFGGSWSGDKGMMSSPHEVSKGKDFGTAAACGVEGKYGEILKNAFDSQNNDGPCTFAFSGLDPAKTYLVQYIIHSTDDGHTAEVTGLNGVKSIRLGATSTGDDWYYGGTLIHVFQPNANGEYSLVVDYRKDGAAANAIVNAFQVREIEAREPFQWTSGWTSKPVTLDGDKLGDGFCEDGTQVFAFMPDDGDPGTTATNLYACNIRVNLLNSLTDTVNYLHDATQKEWSWQQDSQHPWNGVFNDGRQPAAFMTVEPALTRNAQCETVSGASDEFNCMLKRAFINYNGEKTMTVTFKNLTVGSGYVAELYVHHGFNGDKKSVTAPDGVTKAYYGGDAWLYGGVLSGRFVAKTTQESFTFTFSASSALQINAIQLRELGGVTPPKPSSGFILIVR